MVTGKERRRVDVNGHAFWEALEPPAVAMSARAKGTPRFAEVLWSGASSSRRFRLHRL
jgi:hypothetical protein